MASPKATRRALEIAKEAGGLTYWARAETWAPIGVESNSVQVEHLSKYGRRGTHTETRPTLKVSPYTVRDLVQEELLERERPGLIRITPKGEQWLST